MPSMPDRPLVALDGTLSLVRFACMSQAYLLSSYEGGRMTIARWSMETGGGWLIVAALLGLLGLARPADAAEFSCAAGDVACLISPSMPPMRMGQRIRLP